MRSLCLTFLAVLALTKAQFFGLNNPLSTVQKSATNVAGNVQNTATNVAGVVPGGSTVANLTSGALEAVLEESWGGYQKLFNKVYATAEEATLRKEIFIENIKKIEKFNKDYTSGKFSFVQKLNSFADMLTHEFNSIVNGFNRGHKPEKPIEKSSTFIPSANVEIPESMDWREKGAVSPVKQQGLCGGCYAFSAAGAIEGHYYRKTGVLNELSPQNLIDCTGPYGNDACLGGLMDPAFQYVKDNGGIDTLASYAYESKNGSSCRYQKEGQGATTSGFVTLPEGDERALKIAVATLGPVSVAIDASLETFHFYSDGIYFDEKCKSKTEEMNHAMLVVGYGTDTDGKEYWLVKNSYGDEWGKGGYIKMARNANNHCGIANIASYPLV